MSRQAKIKELRRNIEQGHRFMRQGYDCGMLVAISERLLAELLNEEPDADTLTGQAKNMQDALAELRQRIIKALRIDRLMDWLARKLRRS